VTFVRSLVIAAGLLASCNASAGERVAVSNHSRATTCAEVDNIDIRFSGTGVNGFSIAAKHPAYINWIDRDRTEADFTTCDMSGDPSFAASPRTVTIHEDAEWRLVGHTFESFWRGDVVPTRVGARREDGLHLLQLFRMHKHAWIEVLVLYPPDGYWRPKPLPPARFADTGYGSSFLIGPIEQQGRPLVRLSDIEFDPPTRTFRLAFALGGAVTLTLAQVEIAGLRLDVRFSQPADARHFAGLRSMFVTTLNADVAEAGESGNGIRPERRFPILDFKRRAADGAWFGRTIPSLHNSSAPDVSFFDFRR
jgi:hypothetical protein